MKRSIPVHDMGIIVVYQTFLISTINICGKKAASTRTPVHKRYIMISSDKATLKLLAEGCAQENYVT